MGAPLFAAEPRTFQGKNPETLTSEEVSYIKPALDRLGRGGVLIGIVLREIRGDFLDDEFLEEVGGGGGADADGGVFEGEGGASVVRRVVGIGDAGGNQAAENGGVSECQWPLSPLQTTPWRWRKEREKFCCRYLYRSNADPVSGATAESRRR